MPYKTHLSSANDLRTSIAETKAGFVAMALEKSRQAIPHVQEARALAERLKDVNDPAELIKKLEIKAALVAAAGISDKASGHLGEDGRTDAINQFVDEFLIPAGKKFGEEIVFRFLLTRGDTLGGSMRNIVGALAQRKLNTAVAADLSVSGRDFQWLHKASTKWLPSGGAQQNDIEGANGLSWLNPKGERRTLIYNITVPIIKKNVDICLFGAAPPKSSAERATLIGSLANYVALGELKGGIDPAGADEHWKTARSALARIREALNKHGIPSKLFFVGAAIENSMAHEIWNDLETGLLANAANLTHQKQVVSLCKWLTEI